MGNCLTIEEAVADLTQKQIATNQVVNQHTSMITKLTELQLVHAQLHELVKDKRRAWQGNYTKDGLSFDIQIMNSKAVSSKDLDDWTKASVDMVAATKFREIYKPQTWVSSSAGSTLRYRFHDTHLELEYTQEVELLWDSMVDIIARVRIPTSALSPYSSLDQKEEWATESYIWQSVQTNLKEEFIKQIAPDLVPIRIVDEDVSDLSDTEPELGLPISTVLEYLVEQKGTFTWNTVVVPAPV